MSDLVQSGLLSLVPKDSRLTFTLLVAGTGALALLLDYYYRDKDGSAQESKPQVNSKIESGNERMEEAIRYYESALVDMQQAGADTSQRMRIRSMLLRAYEIQAILSPDEFSLRSSVMIEGSTSEMIKEIVQDNLSELDSGMRSNCTTPQALENNVLPTMTLPPPLVSPPASPSASPARRLRSDSISSGGLSDFYEAFDILDEDSDTQNIPPFYKDQIFLHKVKEFTCRTNRFQQFKLSSPSEYLVKVQCIRLAFDRLMKSPEKRSWMLNNGKNNTLKLLTVAGADAEAFSLAYDDMIEYVGNLANLTAIKEELGARKVACINLFDIVIDFCLLDSFDDLDMPPAAVTSVLGNSWISQSLRKTMLSTAVWGMVSTKSSKVQPDGFLKRFYNIMCALSPSLAWGFLGDDPLLRPICAMIRSDLENSLITIFDEIKTDYTTLDSLSEDLYQVLKFSADRLASQLDDALS